MKVIDTLGHKEGRDELAAKNYVNFSKTFIFTFYFLRFCTLEVFVRNLCPPLLEITTLM
jgi:hypothetical protein